MPFRNTIAAVASTAARSGDGGASPTWPRHGQRVAVERSEEPVEKAAPIRIGVEARRKLDEHGCKPACGRDRIDAGAKQIEIVA